MPRFAGIASFMRLPIVASPEGLDIALYGIPWDGGTTNRSGAHHGPREIRNQSSLMRRAHHVSGAEPFSIAKVADIGDLSVNPINLFDAPRASRPASPECRGPAPSRSAREAITCAPCRR